MKLAQKRILITGASSGIGEAFAKEFAKRGAKIILVAYELKKTQKVLEELEGEGHYAFACDFSKPENILKLFEDITSKTEEIDILINNAGIGIYNTIEQIDPKDWFDSFNVNVHAPFMLTKLFLPLIKKSEQPLIINTGSQCGIDACFPRVAYNATKFALRGFSLTLSKEFENTNVRSVYYALSSVLTGFGPLSVEEKKVLEEQGKKYHTPESVAIYLAERIEGNDLPPEIDLIQK